MTLDNDMPAGQAHQLWVLPDRFLIVINAIETCGLVEYEYEHSLRGAPRRLVHRAFRVPDPWVDSEGYRRGAIWNNDEPAQWAWIDEMEAVGLLVPYAHVR